MPRTYADMAILIQTKLADTASVYYPAAEINYQIRETLKELSGYATRIQPIIYKLESRTGTDLTGTASTLTDSVKKQFLSTDPTNEKVVHNITDNTWATITGYTSTSVVGLSADIMAANESYEIFNKHCTNKRQIYIGDFYEYSEIDRVEYPLGTERNFEVKGDILEIECDYIPDSDSTLDNLSNLDVLVYYKRPHILSNLTDSLGTVKTAAAAAATVLAGSSLQATGTIEPGEEFYIATHRNPYVVTAQAAIASNTTSMNVYPPLEAAAASALVITFKQSTLTPNLEQVFADYAAGQLAINKATSLVQEAQGAVSIIATATTALASMTARITAATTLLASGTTQIAAMTTAIAAATVEVALMNAEVDKAVALLVTGSALINTVPVGGGALEYASIATADINAAQGYLSDASGFFREAQLRGVNGASYIAQGTGQLQAAASYLSQAYGNLRQVTSKIAIAGAGKHLESWGQNKVNSAKQQLRTMAKPKSYKVHTRD